MWSPEPENCQNRNPHTSKIGKLLPVCLTNSSGRSDHISEPHAKFRFLFPVSFAIEYKVGIVEFYLFVQFGAHLLKNVVTRA